MKKTQKKSGTVARRKITPAKPSNGAATPAPAKPKAKAEGHKVGQKIVLEGTDLETVEVCEREITKAQARLGALLDEYRKKENQIRDNLNTLHQEYHAVVMTLGRKLKIPVDASDQSWRFDFDTKSFTRVR